MNTSVSNQTALYAYECFIPFHLADPAGILFYGHVFTLSHQAFEHFVMDYLGYSWNNWFQNKEWVVPIRHTEANFFAPIEAGKNCRIELNVSLISQCSFTVIYRFIQQERCCEVSIVHVFCDKLEKKKISIPQDVLEKLNFSLEFDDIFTEQ